VLATDDLLPRWPEGCLVRPRRTLANASRQRVISQLQVMRRLALLVRGVLRLLLGLVAALARAIALSLSSTPLGLGGAISSPTAGIVGSARRCAPEFESSNSAHTR
jgi:hypothetical protein